MKIHKEERCFSEKLRELRGQVDSSSYRRRLRQNHLSFTSTLSVATNSRRPLNFRGVLISDELYYKWAEYDAETLRISDRFFSNIIFLNSFISLLLDFNFT